MRYALVRLMVRLTGKARYVPRLLLSEHSFVFNLFRAYEQVFGRRFGVRLEAVTQNSGGFIFRKFYTLEARLMWWEHCLIASFLEWKMAPLKKLVFSVGLTIAFDAAAGAGSAKTWSHTASGSDRGMVIFGVCDNKTISAADFNGDAATQKVDISGAGWNHRGFVLVNPDEGTHTVTLTTEAPAGDTGGNSVSFSGVNQSEMAGGVGSQYNGNCTSLETGVTSQQATSLLCDDINISVSSGYDVGTGQTIRRNPNGTVFPGASTKAASGGADTMLWHWTNLSHVRHVIIEILAVSVAGGTNFFAMF